MITGVDLNTLLTSCASESAPCANNDSKNTSPALVDVLIAGAGIGGLVAALCLHRAGYSVRVHERLTKLEPIGYGLNLQPFSVKVLHELGLDDAMKEVGVSSTAMLFYSHHGQLIHNEAIGLATGCRWSSYSIHRGNFQQLLLRRVQEEIGETAVRLGHKLVAFRTHADYVEVGFVDSSTGRMSSERAKVLVGADGINSTVRRILYPDEGDPLWRGIVLHRGVTRTNETYLDGRTMVLMGNPDNVEFIMYPVSANLLNWACYQRVGDSHVRAPPVALNWNSLGCVDDVLPLISHMKLDFVDIHHVVQSALIINKFPITDREPLSRWTYGRVTLLGDAAHPMYPNGGNGASQAIIDARELVACFRQHGVTLEGLQAYEDLRRTVTNKIVVASRQFGLAEILKIVDERGPNGFNKLSDVISTTELENVLFNFKQMTGLNIENLNHEPSLY